MNIIYFRTIFAILTTIAIGLASWTLNAVEQLETSVSKVETNQTWIIELLSEVRKGQSHDR